MTPKQVSDLRDKLVMNVISDGSQFTPSSEESKFLLGVLDELNRLQRTRQPIWYPKSKDWDHNCSGKGCSFLGCTAS